MELYISPLDTSQVGKAYAEKQIRQYIGSKYSIKFCYGKTSISKEVPDLLHVSMGEGNWFPTIEEIMKIGDYLPRIMFKDIIISPNLFRIVNCPNYICISKSNFAIFTSRMQQVVTQSQNL